MTAETPVRRALLDALALVWPVECAGCGAHDRALCSACRRALTPEVRLAVGVRLPVYVAARYEGVTQGVILAYKTGRTPLRSALAPLLAAALARARAVWGGEAAAPLELCPVPSSRAAFRRRGYDPVRTLLRALDERPGRILHPARPHADQKALSRDSRRQNLRGVYRARGSLAGRRFVLVDDVVTTGATLEAVADALRAAGGEVLGAVAVAATPRTGRPRATLR